MRYRDRYLFDLQGYLSVPKALSAGSVEQLNEVIDEMAEREMGRSETTHRWFDLLARSRSFRDLIDNPPGHKSAFAFPDSWKDLSDPHPCVRKITGPAGSAIIFTEALTHGTLPWRGSDDRRTVFYRYRPRPLAWSRTFTIRPSIRTSPRSSETSSRLQASSACRH